MAVAPKFAYAILNVYTYPVHTIELYLDYTCPFSKKLFDQFYQNIVPVIEEKYSKKVQVIFRHQVQPWHPSSTLVHEAALAVGILAPHRFWEFSHFLFLHQAKYFDEHVYHESRKDTYTRLATSAVHATGGEEFSFEGIYALLEIPASTSTSTPASNSGNKVTNDLKLHIKEARLRGIHVSPTVVVDGNVDNSVSSGWSVEEWKGWLEKTIV